MAAIKMQIDREKHLNQWVAVDDRGNVVVSGKTIDEVQKKAGGQDKDWILLYVNEMLFRPWTVSGVGQA